MWSRRWFGNLFEPSKKNHLTLIPLYFLRLLNHNRHEVLFAVFSSLQCEGWSLCSEEQLDHICVTDLMACSMKDIKGSGPPWSVFAIWALPLFRGGLAFFNDAYTVDICSLSGLALMRLSQNSSRSSMSVPKTEGQDSILGLHLKTTNWPQRYTDASCMTLHLILCTDVASLSGSCINTRTREISWRIRRGMVR